jgi:hypothetical protein
MPAAGLDVLGVLVDELVNKIEGRDLEALFFRPLALGWAFAGFRGLGRGRGFGRGRGLRPSLGRRGFRFGLRLAAAGPELAGVARLPARVLALFPIGVGAPA